MLLLSGALAGSILGFLFYNFNPATIFMGDTGSMFLGFVLAVASIRSSQKTTATVAIAVPLLALAVPITDTLLAMGRRAARGAPLFSADRGHIHHRLLDRGFSHRTAVLIIYLGATLGGAAALMISFTKGTTPALVLLGAAVVAFIVLRALGFLDLKKAQAALTDRKRNLELRAAVRKAGERLRSVRTPEELWRSVLHAAPAFGAVGVRLTLGRMEGKEGWGPWEVGFEDLPEDALQARYGLIAERPGDDHIDLIWTDGRASVHRDTEIAVELFCEQVSAALERLEGLDATGTAARSQG
jgi:UDP-GlcNAc:undecaprenyl-phosphate GlcNAc-1-phosphate transferase